MFYEFLDNMGIIESKMSPQMKNSTHLTNPFQHKYPNGPDIGQQTPFLIIKQKKS